MAKKEVTEKLAENEVSEMSATEPNKKEKKAKKERKWWFFIPKAILRLIIKKPKFKYLGDEIEEGSIILRNHEGASGPLKLELYLNHSFRLWGAWEMNSHLGHVYTYLSKVYYHQKKHWPLFWARLFCVIAAPIVFLFYRGLNLISTYPDARLKRTIKQSVATIEKGQSVVLFPEDSSTGYHETLKAFLPGFTLFAKTCYKKGIDVPIYVAYLKKKTNTFVIDKPVKFSELYKDYQEPEEIANILCNRINEIKDLI